MKKLALIISTIFLMSSATAMAESKRQLNYKIELLEFQLNQCKQEIEIVSRGRTRVSNRKIGHVCTLKLSIFGMEQYFTGGWAKLPADAKRLAIQECKDEGLMEKCNMERYTSFKCTKSKR